MQQILFYKELGVDLESIKNMLLSPSFSNTNALKDHREKLLTKRKQLDILITNVDKTIASAEGRIMMNDKEKFEGFKQNLIDENEKKYGEEIRSKYGNDAVNKSNKNLKNMNKEQYEEFEKLGSNVIDTLKEAFATNDPSSELSQKAADLHRQWLTYSWSKYSKEAHAGLAQMYVDDERFTAFYDKHQPGLAIFLRDAVLVYTGLKK